MAQIGNFRKPAPPPKKDDGMGKLLTIGGAAVGGFFGGPSGAMAGAQLGGMAGGMLADNSPAAEAPEQQQLASDGGAMSRRMSELDASPQMQIRQSIDSLKYVQNPEQRAELAKPLLQADYLARNKAQV